MGDRFSRTARQIYDRWRGFQPWPGAHTMLRGKKLIVHRMHVGESGGLRSGWLLVGWRVDDGGVRDGGRWSWTRCRWKARSGWVRRSFCGDIRCERRAAWVYERPGLMNDKTGRQRTHRERENLLWPRAWRASRRRTGRMWSGLGSSVRGRPASAGPTASAEEAIGEGSAGAAGGV
jgi:hypothetical protein